MQTRKKTMLKDLRGMLLDPNITTSGDLEQSLVSGFSQIQLMIIIPQHKIDKYVELLMKSNKPLFPGLVLTFTNLFGDGNTVKPLFPHLEMNTTDKSMY